MPRGAGRNLITIAGASASGKSTLATDLTKALQKTGRKTQSIPMDGFHLDKAVLQERGLLSRKGAPETFDAEGLIVLIKRVKAGGEVVYATLDRAPDLSVAGAAVIDADCDVAVFEGNLRSVRRGTVAFSGRALGHLDLVRYARIRVARTMRSALAGSISHTRGRPRPR